ncbi:MAG: NDP-sugar synthase [Actinomycetota bacterium]|nr:NDP-sugar synthase [Actinomycetota bacterium]
MSLAAVLFAAGRGQRLRPLTDEVAKPALPVLDVPLAAFGLRRLFDVAPAVVLNLRHLPESVTTAVAPYLPLDGRLDALYETPEAYGTAGTLAAVADRVTSRVVTWNSDLLTDLDALSLVRAHEASGAPATIAVAEVASGADFVLEGGRAVAFVDRRERSDVAGGVFIGAAVFERAALDALPETRPAGLGETLLAWLADAGNLAVHRHDRYWRDVATPASYLDASLDLLEGHGPEPPGGSWPGDVVEVEDGVAYLGPGAAATEDALGPGAILLARSTAGAGSRIERSIVWPDEHLPRGTQLRDAIWFGGRRIVGRH